METASILCWQVLEKLCRRSIQDSKLFFCSAKQLTGRVKVISVKFESYHGGASAPNMPMKITRP